MPCFCKRSKKPKGNYNNPAYNFANSTPLPPARPANPQYSYSQHQVISEPPHTPYPAPNSNPPNQYAQGLLPPAAPIFRPDGAVPDGNGALPDYTHSNTQWTPGSPPRAPPPSSFQPQGYGRYNNNNPQAGNKEFKSPPIEFSPSAAGDSDDDLPPPPVISHEISPTSNTTSALADAGYEFCSLNPLSPPQQFTQSALSQLSSTTILPLASPPVHFRGSVTSHGRTVVETAHKGGCPDTCITSTLPLFCAGYHHPANTGKARQIYFEVTLETLPDDAVVAVGFVGCPYPGFRLPGWNRGSLGVHSDDGRRYCNDSYGGKDFTERFRVGERVGIGMKFPLASSGCGVEIFFNRNGVAVGGWRLDEETDAELDWPATEGLDGAGDVYAAIGVWGSGIRVAVDHFYSREER